MLCVSVRHPRMLFGFIFIFLDRLATCPGYTISGPMHAGTTSSPLRLYKLVQKVDGWMDSCNRISQERRYVFSVMGMAGNLLLQLQLCPHIKSACLLCTAGRVERDSCVCLGLTLKWLLGSSQHSILLKQKLTASRHQHSTVGKLLILPAKTMTHACWQKQEIVG